MKIAKSLDIGENETNLAVTTFDDEGKLQIKFSDHTNYSSFEKAVYAIDDDLGSTYTDEGLRVAYEEMFNPANGMRTDVPNAMIFMTDGDCTDCTIESLKYWNKKFRNERIKLIGIAIGQYLNVTQIETFVGEENYVGTEITEIIKPEFIKNLSICESMYSYLVLILIRIKMEFVIKYFRHILISCEKYST